MMHALFLAAMICGAIILILGLALLIDWLTQKLD